MKKLNGLQKAVANIFGLPNAVNPVQNNPLVQSFGFNNGVTIYPYGKDETYIGKGYNKNYAVFSIVSACASKFSQVPWYHMKVKTSERKTYFDEYMVLTKSRAFVFDQKARIEAKKMLKKSVDETAVQSPLSDFLKKPNRNQSGAQFREQLYGFKLLTGEGNMWLSRTEPNAKPSEMFIIPKKNLALKAGQNIWDISDCVLLFGGQEFGSNKANVMRWIFPSYANPSITLDHLRGQSPLDAGLLLMQSMNEGTERLAAMNKNQGVAGMVFDKGKRDYPTQPQAQFIRQQFNEVVNDKDLAGQIAWMTGDLGYIQFGLDAGQLKLLEQSDVQFKNLCGIFHYPWQLMGGDPGSYENRKQYKREFVYDNIAVACYGLRDEWNASLIPAFGLDRDRDVIDCGIMDLPELSEDLKTQAETLKSIWQLTPNQVLEYIGYDKSTDPNMDKIYIPSGYQSLDDANMQVGGDLTNDVNALNQ